MARPSFGRTLSVRGYDCTDTPPATIEPVFAREPLLRASRRSPNRSPGPGWLATAMRAKGLIVHAGDIFPRGCPDCATCDFFDLERAPCGTLLSNPPYRSTEPALDHAWKIGFRTVILLLRTTFLHSVGRYETIHKSGRLARVFVLAERLTMHDERISRLAERRRVSRKRTLGLLSTRRITGRRRSFPPPSTIPPSACRGSAPPCVLFRPRSKGDRSMSRHIIGVDPGSISAAFAFISWDVGVDAASAFHMPVVSKMVDARAFLPKSSESASRRTPWSNA